MTAPALYRRVARNETGRDILVGDVHGCFTGLREALDAIKFDDSAGDRLFFVGDLVDRGPESMDALWWLSQPWAHAVRGNHEQMAIDYVAGLGDDGLYLANGGAWFLGLTRPEQVAIADTFSALPLAIELETAAGLVGIVHAECPTLEFRQIEAELQGVRAQGIAACCQWSRTRIDNRYADLVPDVRAVVVGHTPLRTGPVTLGNHLYIDTMGWRGGQFTLLDAATLQPVKSSWPVGEQKLATEQ